MSTQRRPSWRNLVGIVTTLVLFAVIFSATAASGGTSVRGFDGTTIKTGGLVSAANFAGSDLGTKARFKRANDTNEVKGIKFEYIGFADDKQDPTVATSEARRLVTQEGVFAIVPALSPVVPGQYLTDSHVPYVGWGLDNTYCSAKPTTKLWGFGYNGCLTPSDPKVVPDLYGARYEYVKQKSGEKSPTIAMFSNDNQSGTSAMKNASTAAAGAGFKVVYAKPVIPLTVTDYTPYVQDFMTADNGKPPSVINCLLSVQCVPIWAGVKAAGFNGIFLTSLYTNALVKPLQGTVASVTWNPSPSAGLTQMQKDFEAITPGTPVTGTNAAAYFAADKFIEAVKKLPKSKITPENVQKILAKQTWQIEGLVGPNKYPASTAAANPYCQAIFEDTDGATWTQAVPYTCSAKTFKVTG
jgi:ABC-type branched-subunit amino acid transport system substrate-binding protein